MAAVRHFRSSLSNTSNEMAIYKQGVLGPFSGKVGTVVGSSWRGVPYIRSLATKVANPRTQGQVAARSRLAAVAGRLKHFAYVISAGFVNSGALSPWSAAIKANMKALTGSSDQPVVDMSALALSDGSATFDVKTVKSASSIDFSWKAPKVSDAFYGGTLYAAAYNVANGKAVNFLADLSAAAASFDFQTIIAGEDDDVHVYFFVATQSLSTATTHLGN